MRTLWKRAALMGLVALIGLASLNLRAQDKPQDQVAAVEAVIARYEAAVNAFRAQYRAASAEERAKLSGPKAEDYLPELVSLAEGAVGTDAAARAWMMVVQLAPQAKEPDLEVFDLAVEALLRDHLASERVATLGGMIAGASRAIGEEKTVLYLRQVAEKAPHGALQGGALFALAQKLSDAEPAAGSAEEKELGALLEKLERDFAEVKDPRGSSYGALAGAMIYERKHLQIGMAAPEIEAADLNGVSFKLSDYRGKVVLLDFWGNW
jgi:hypothetical protein